MTDTDGMFYKPGKSKNQYNLLCKIDELLLNYSPHCGLLCVVKSLFNNFTTVSFGYLCDKKTYNIQLLFPYSGCYSMQLIYGHFETLCYNVYIDDTHTLKNSNYFKNNSQRNKFKKKLLPLSCFDKSILEKLQYESIQNSARTLFNDRNSSPSNLRQLALCSTPRTNLSYLINNEKSDSNIYDKFSPLNLTISTSNDTSFKLKSSSTYTEDYKEHNSKCFKTSYKDGYSVDSYDSSSCLFKKQNKSNTRKLSISQNCNIPHKFQT